MTHSTVTPQDAAALAERLLRGPDPAFDRPAAILAHPEGRGPLERRAALRPLHDAIVARVGPPTLLGGTDHGPSVRWGTDQRTLLLSGDSVGAALSVHEARAFAEREYAEFVAGGLPYAWALDRGSPLGPDRRLIDSSMARSCSWQGAEERLALLLASWVEQLPVQAPGDWLSFRLRAERTPPLDLVVSYDPRETGGELRAVVPSGRLTLEGAARMRRAGWQGLDDHGRWHVALPETDPRAPARLAGAVTARVRSGPFDYPGDVFATAFSVGDHGTLVVPGLGFEVTLSRDPY
ncbi:hypothetical protein LG943_02375 [Streptomonospora sp. S1-112]|uniref:Uncharacterized protein n=1 Tax=Streptomonospora mangrovi TaxID=2883123 RepID=A0A9X3NME8_9ACTN|nr:hypothetical protein [Streptomonospora mangrovi]MDA0563180.1 hypothetical protein [Streptomonospora mangrovi]